MKVSHNLRFICFINNKKTDVLSIYHDLGRKGIILRSFLSLEEMMFFVWSHFASVTCALTRDLFLFIRFL